MAKEQRDRATWSWLNALIILFAIGVGVWSRATGEGLYAGLVIVATLVVLVLAVLAFGRRRPS